MGLPDASSSAKEGAQVNDAPRLGTRQDRAQHLVDRLEAVRADPFAALTKSAPGSR